MFSMRVSMLYFRDGVQLSNPAIGDARFLSRTPRVSSRRVFRLCVIRSRDASRRGDYGGRLLLASAPYSIERNKRRKMHRPTADSIEAETPLAERRVLQQRLDSSAPFRLPGFVSRSSAASCSRVASTFEMSNHYAFRAERDHKSRVRDEELPAFGHGLVPNNLTKEQWEKSLV